MSNNQYSSIHCFRETGERVSWGCSRERHRPEPVRRTIGSLVLPQLHWNAAHVDLLEEISNDGNRLRILKERRYDHVTPCDGVVDRVFWDRREIRRMRATNGVRKEDVYRRNFRADFEVTPLPIAHGEMEQPLAEAGGNVVAELKLLNGEEGCRVERSIG